MKYKTTRTSVGKSIRAIRVYFLKYTRVEADS